MMSIKIWVFTEKDHNSESLLESTQNPENAIIVLTQSGKGKIIQHSGTIFLVKNSIVFLEPDTLKSLDQITSDFRLKIVVYQKAYLGEVNFKLDKLKIFKYFSLYFKEFVDFSSHEMSLLFEQIRTIEFFQNCSGVTGFDSKVMELLFSAFIYSITGIYLNNDFFEKHKMSRADEITFQFTKNVYKYCIHEKSPKFYSDLQNITSRHLTSMVKSVTGKTASEVITEFVMNEAKILLESTDKTVKQIADELNFGDSYTFSHYFKRNEGESPINYRSSTV